MFSSSVIIVSCGNEAMSSVYKGNSSGVVLVESIKATPEISLESVSLKLGFELNVLLHGVSVS